MIKATIILGLLLAIGVPGRAVADGAFDHPFPRLEWRRTQVFGEFNQDKDGYHLGEDWAERDRSTEGEPVHAIGDGVVIKAHNGGRCWADVVMILHTAPSDRPFQLPGGAEAEHVTSFYGHLRNLSVEVNDYVRRGQRLGEVASTTSCSDAPHLHFEVRRNLVNVSGNIPLGLGYLDNPLTDSASWIAPSEFIFLNRLPVRLANKLDGVWRGTGHQNNGSTWTIRLTVEPGRYSIEYPSLDCGGSWTLRTQTPYFARFDEQLSRGAGLATCIRSGVVELYRRAEDRLQYIYYRSTGSIEAYGVLRAIAPPTTR